jgi:hypothetical protein
MLDCRYHPFLLALGFRLRPALIRASRVTPPLFHSSRWSGMLCGDNTLTWLSATTFKKPHSLRSGNRLILQVRNRGN